LAGVQRRHILFQRQDRQPLHERTHPIAQFRRLCDGIREAKRNFPDLPLVDIEEKDGDMVMITL